MTPARRINLSKKQALLLAFLVCLVVVSFYIFSDTKMVPPSPSKELMDVSRGLDNASYDLVFKPQDHTLAVTLALDYTNRTPETLEEIALRIPSNAFLKEETSPAASKELYELCYPKGFSPSGFTLHDVKWNEQAAQAQEDEQDATVLWVKIPKLPPGQRGTLRMRCVILLPEVRHRLGRSDSIYMLGSALPFPAQYTENGWETHPYLPVGDPPTPGLSNFTFTLSLPEGYACAAPFVWQRQDSGLQEGSILAARDVGLVIYKGAQVAQKMAGGILLQSFAQTAADAQKALGYAAKTLASYQKQYGNYPWPVYTVAMADMPFAGMEYTGLIMVGRGQYQVEDSLEMTIAHETAHQWFGMLVGSDPFYNAWQDEAVCEYLSLAYVRDTYGATAFEQLKFLMADSPMRENIREDITPGSPLDRFYTLEEYSTVVYGRGLALMLALETDMDLKAFLQNYCKQFAFSTATRQDFERLLQQSAGWDTWPLMMDYLDTAM